MNHWRQHEPILIEFEDAWKQESVPDLAKFFDAVKEVDDPNGLLAELAMIDFEYRFNRDSVVSVTSYFDEFQQLQSDPNAREELLTHEFHLRKSSGQLLTERELQQRFPGESVGRQLYEEICTSSHPNFATAVTSGAFIGPYQVIEKVGEGAFASVFSAFDTRLNRDVALKFLNLGQLDTSARLRLKREAKAVATLQHTNIVEVFGAGNHLGYDYVITRLVDGVSLNQVLKDNHPSVESAVEIVLQLCSAVSHAHDGGIIHRDIKPANVMIENGKPLLLDFGLAHVTDSSQQLTHDGDMVGTPAFMPPEQADGRGWQADPRSDVYSLGAMLFLMVFRKLPFEGTTSEIISQIIHREPSVPRENKMGISRDLQTIILKCLQKEPTDRYQTAAELQSDLQSYRDGKPIVARPLGLPGRIWKWSRRRPVVASLLLIVGALSIFGIGVASQLNNVTIQRDRAQQAEMETQSLLSMSAADAGRLAMQRGKLDLAVEHFEQALERGYPDRTELFLALVEAKFALRQADDAQRYMALARERPIDTKHRPQMTMWQAELALENPAEQETGEKLLDSARKMKLPSADQHYIDGVLADSSHSAVKSLRQATEIDPYHYRSRRMLIFMLFSLAEINDAQDQLQIARQLYPDDQDFLLLSSLVNAALGDTETAEALLRNSSLDDESKKDWEEFLNALNDICYGNLFPPDNAEQSLLWINRLSQQFENKFAPLLKHRNWRFPPKIGRQFALFTNSLKALSADNLEPAIESLEQLVEIHPESSLLMTLGSLKLANVSGHSNQDEITLLEESRDYFSQSLECPGFMKQSGQRSMLAVFTTSMTLALVHKHEAAKNTKYYSQASQTIRPDVADNTDRARAFFIAALMAPDYDEADRWMERWQQLPNKTNEQEIDMIWHHAVLCQRREEWLAVRKLCEQILEIEPVHEPALAFHLKATRKVQQALKSGPSSEKEPTPANQN